MSPARVDLLTNLGIPAVAARGWSALTPAVIAEAAGCNRQAVHQWFGPGTAMRTAFAQRHCAVVSVGGDPGPSPRTGRAAAVLARCARLGAGVGRAARAGHP